MQETTKQQQAKTHKKQQQGMKIISNAPRGGLLWSPTLRSTTLGPTFGLERLRMIARRSEGRKERRLDSIKNRK